MLVYLREVSIYTIVHGWFKLQKKQRGPALSITLRVLTGGPHWGLGSQLDCLGSKQVKLCTEDPKREMARHFET